MEEKKKSNGGLIVTVILLVLIVLGLGGYLVWDKVLNNTESNKVDNKVEKENNEVEVKELDTFYEVTKNDLNEDVYYIYNNYLPVLVRYLYADEAVDTNGDGQNEFVLDNNKYKNLTDDDIKSFLYTYYNRMATMNEMAEYEGNSMVIDNISKEELDRIVYMVFNKENMSDYSFTFREVAGNFKNSDGSYKFVWYPTGGASNYLANSVFKKSGSDYVIESTIYESNDGGVDYIGRAKFSLKYDSNKGLYYINNVETMQ